jgi:hypothetical protein
MENQSPVMEPVVNKKTPVINKKMPDAEVLKVLDEYCDDLQRDTAKVDKLRQMVGRLLVEVRGRRLYESKGYKSFDAFLEKEMEERHSISRATAYNAIQVAEALPDLSVEQAERIGTQRLKLVAQVIKRDERPEPEKKRLALKLLSRAEKMSLLKFRSSLEKDGLLNENSAGPKLVIAIKAGRQLMAAWKKAVGDDDPATVLWRLLKGVRVKPVVHHKKAA